MIALKYPSTKDNNVDFHYLERKDKNSDFFVREITRLYENKIPSINTIEIETINRCNNDCSFCPVNRNSDTRPYKKMSQELFEKIINELVDMDYRGFISLFSNNEPLVDVRILDFIKYAKEKLPKATHCLYTNGVLLNKDNYEQMTKYLDYLVIDNYNDDLELLDNVKEIVDEYKDLETRCKVSVLFRKKNQVLLNRGGEAPNRQQNEKFSSSCILPFMQMIIRPDGEVSRCCQDALAKTTLGNVEKNTIEEVWTGDAYQDFRKSLIENGRQSVTFCENCDSFGISNYFPDIWIDIVAKTIVNMVWDKKKAGKKIYLYEDNKVTRYVDKLLKMHGAEIDGVIGNDDRDIILQEDAFTIFSSNDYPILDEIDYDFKLLGNKYIVYEEVNHSLHTDFIDENLNAETKEFIRFIDTIRNKDTIVFGTGFSAEKVNEVFRIDAKYYIDNNQKKEGTDYCGKKIWLPSKLKDENQENICVVIASLKYNEMKKQLLENELCKEENIFEGLRYLD